MDTPTSLHPPSETPKCTRHHRPVDLQHERMDCVLNEISYDVPPLSTSGVTKPGGVASRWPMHLATPWLDISQVRSGLAILHLYNNPAWRTCCL